MKYPLFTIVQIPVELLDIPEGMHPLKEMNYPENVALKESVRLHGIRRPINVCDLRNGRFLVLCGTHRARCVESGTVPCIIVHPPQSLFTTPKLVSTRTIRYK